MARKKQLNSDAPQTTTPTSTASTKRQAAPKPKPATRTTTDTTAGKTPRKPLARRAGKATSAQQAQPQPDIETPPVAMDTSNAVPWRRIDLHLHTPGSHDYEEPTKTYLDILKQAEKRGLSAIAFTDHNTVNGYRNMLAEIERLEYLERLQRIHADELWRLNEYRRLMNKMLVLPGFEFTATFGFHILGIFPADKPLRDIERVLMDLRVPGPVLDKGLTEAGATSDVLAAYEAIDEAGGIAIAAHANSSNGVSMRGMSLGGQTRIAFTQDPHLYAIEFTDLEKGRHSSAHLFTGIKPEYPRRMFAIQGSDAHRLAVSKENVKRLGVGERPTEVQMERVTFDAIKDLFRSQDFHRVRPVFTVVDVPDDALALARQMGAGVTAAFYPSLPKRGDRFEQVLRDVAAMANGEGGSVFIGCDVNPNKKIPGVADAAEVTSKLSDEIVKRISPHLSPHIGVNDADGAQVVVVRVPAGADAPYTFDGAQFVVRNGAETRAATRDDIVAIALRGYEKNRQQQPPSQPSSQTPQQPGQRGQQDHRRQHSDQRDARDPRQGRRHDPRQDPRRPQDQRGGDRRQTPGGQPHNDRRPAQGQREGRGNQQARPQGQRDRQPHTHPQPLPSTPPGTEVEAQQIQVQPAETGLAVPTPTPDAVGTSTTAQNGTLTPTGANNNGNGARGSSAPAEAPLPGTPRTGVQVTTMESRNGIDYFTVRDLRNNSIIRNVTRKSARDLWHYAVTQHAEHAGGYDPATIDWQADSERAVLSREMRAGKMRSDLALLTDDAKVQVFYGVTDDGVDAEWKTLIADYEAARTVNVADEDEPEEVFDDDGFIDEPQP